MSSGWVSAATSSTHPCKREWLELAWCVGAVWAMGVLQLLMSRRDSRSYPGQRAYDPQIAEIRWGLTTHSTFDSADWPTPDLSPDSFLGTSTRRLNSATSTPSWLSTRVCTR